MIDLKNKLSEEEAIELLASKISAYGFNTSYYAKSIQDTYFQAWKQLGIIRKSAREELFETLESHKKVALTYNRADMVYVYDELKQLIDSALKEAAERVDNNERYNELLMAVENKYPNETRHETALRLITDSQKSSNKSAAEERKEG